MPRTKRWNIHPTVDGVKYVVVSSWKYFPDLINQKLLDLRGYVFRGHRSAGWQLESTLDRALKNIPASTRFTRMTRHLEHFQLAVRGRRGTNPPTMKTENDWWALGQHHGLATPLLDWTASPYAAAFFAYENENNPTEPRAIWAIHFHNIEHKKNPAIIAATNAASPSGSAPSSPKINPPIVEFFRPLTDENQRLVNQSGLFTRAPLGTDIETWVKTHYKGDTFCALLKIVLPDRDRQFCLKSLNRMNINHATLFPDLYGSSHFCNLELKINAY